MFLRISGAEDLGIIKRDPTDEELQEIDEAGDMLVRFDESKGKFQTAEIVSKTKMIDDEEVAVFSVKKWSNVK
jgi:cell fate (sporulation/competence/biofilm development) regulator YlbF (YheA/YmcA/DUF963 family)